MPQAQPELKKYMEKRVFCQLNGNRKVIGILRGYDVCSHPMTLSLRCRVAPWRAVEAGRKTVPIKRGITDDTFAQVFMNIVLDEAFEEKDGGEKVSIGMIVIRGNSVVMLEALERITDK
ncbi:Ribonucleoprotein LSM domain, eukaryotic/archaea-type [Penicillium expansum]|uniref:Small nuclear ribonucleoprotein G n=1 Tax=Penicillium expansum TaxID=27334 RepID=A0A0A2JG18_PENEN|nr:Ribonucleoprotein LSM domain, eukaryotic/archaea-type [Penicillium expansum]KGO45948.1 Ribonucleoprotein LSM domain, eukaryotic/archaea-type [Penicillium expansum]KGO46380.1 Ribonucleoprotein LSM domain, eukaryotic/archaea-type [Penicillium expansum]KGO54324.1 Ribonucleoprotein LSM domain, eukaryotic/archaea-type [Penicillium expansum]